MRDVQSPIRAHARQKSAEYCVQVATKGESANPDWLLYCCKILYCKSSLQETDQESKEELLHLLISSWQSGERLQRRVQSAQRTGQACGTFRGP